MSSGKSKPNSHLSSSEPYQRAAAAADAGPPSARAPPASSSPAPPPVSTKATPPEPRNLPPAAGPTCPSRAMLTSPCHWEHPVCSLEARRSTLGCPRAATAAARGWELEAASPPGFWVSVPHQAAVSQCCSWRGGRGTPSRPWHLQGYFPQGSESLCSPQPSRMRSQWQNKPVQMEAARAPAARCGRERRARRAQLVLRSEVRAWKRNKEMRRKAQGDPSVFEEYLFIYQLMYLFYLVLLHHLENKES